MRRYFALGATCVVAVAVSTGCGEGAALSHGVKGNCVRAWNDAGNGDNRRAVIDAREPWRAVVSRWIVFHPREGFTGNGCSYFFFSDKRWMTFSGAWESDGDLRWGIPPTQGGRRRTEQRPSKPNAELRRNGTLRQRLRAWRLAGIAQSCGDAGDRTE